MDSRVYHPLHVAPPTSTFHEVSDFQKGIKCDITLYHIFKDDRKYDSWYHKTHAIASAHGTETVFNPLIALQKLLKLYYGRN